MICRAEESSYDVASKVGPQSSVVTNQYVFQLNIVYKNGGMIQPGDDGGWNVDQLTGLDLAHWQPPSFYLCLPLSFISLTIKDKAETWIKLWALDTFDDMAKIWNWGDTEFQRCCLAKPSHPNMCKLRFQIVVLWLCKWRRRRLENAKKEKKTPSIPHYTGKSPSPISNTKVPITIEQISPLSKLHTRYSSLTSHPYATRSREAENPKISGTCLFLSEGMRKLRRCYPCHSLVSASAHSGRCLQHLIPRLASYLHYKWRSAT